MVNKYITKWHPVSEGTFEIDVLHLHDLQTDFCWTLTSFIIRTNGLAQTSVTPSYLCRSYTSFAPSHRNTLHTNLNPFEKSIGK